MFLEIEVPSVWKIMYASSKTKKHEKIYMANSNEAYGTKN